MLALGMRNLNKNGRFENDISIIVNPCYDALAILRNADDLHSRGRPNIKATSLDSKSSAQKKKLTGFMSSAQGINE